jgi:hypothetical protein
MNPVLAFEQYLVLKRHFTDPKFHIHDRLQRFPVTEATYIKYGSGTSKLVKKYGEDVYNYFIANFVAGDAHGGLYNGDEARDNYLAWKKRNQSLSYTFSQEMGWPKFTPPRRERTPIYFGAFSESASPLKPFWS